MIGLALFGNWLLHQLGIGLAAFPIGGGRSWPGRSRPFCCPASSVNRAAARPDRLVAVVCAISAVCFRGAKLAARRLGRTGNALLSGLLGILLAAYSVQFVLNGVAIARAA